MLTDSHLAFNIKYDWRKLYLTLLHTYIKAIIFVKYYSIKETLSARFEYGLYKIVILHQCIHV